MKSIPGLRIKLVPRCLLKFIFGYFDAKILLLQKIGGGPGGVGGQIGVKGGENTIFLSCIILEKL
jgi:hypothetical protein